MKTLTLTPTATARIWLTSTFTMLPPDGVERRITDATADTLVRDSVILEAFVPRGGRAEYGLVGFIHRSAAGYNVEVEVPFIDEQSPLLPDSLAARVDEVRLGIPRDFAKSVLDAIGCEPLPPGVLRVTAAAHGRVGSSKAFFARLTSAAVHLLRRGWDDEQAIAKDLRRILV